MQEIAVDRPTTNVVVDQYGTVRAPCVIALISFPPLLLFLSGDARGADLFNFALKHERDVLDVGGRPLDDPQELIRTHPGRFGLPGGKEKAQKYDSHFRGPQDNTTPRNVASARKPSVNQAKDHSSGVDSGAQLVEHSSRHRRSFRVRAASSIQSTTTGIPATGPNAVHRQRRVGPQ